MDTTRTPRRHPATTRVKAVAAAAVSAGVLLAGLTACSSQDDSDTADAAATNDAAATGTPEPGTGVPAPEQDAADWSCTADPADLASLAASTLAVGVTGFDDAAAAVDAGVRHIFIGSGTDLSILDGQGEPERSISALKDRARAAGGELAVSVDEEGGQVQRLGDIIGDLPSARELADTLSPEEVRGVYAEHGAKMRDLGITVDFAPVVDLAGGESISDNAIGDRSFSDDPQVVTEYGRAAVEGLLDSDVAPVIKHYPGHGHATGDSHLGTVTTPPLQDLGPDLEPFTALAQIPGVSVMVGHMQTPGLDAPGVNGAETPASLNPAAYALLRESFGGVIYTDDLTGMQAITDLHPGPQAVVEALRAGANAPLTSTAADVPATVDGVVAAVESGGLDRARVQDASDKLCGA